ncbi:MAG: helicase HerA domain-containing protein, partial [Gemmataceae bacterium]
MSQSSEHAGNHPGIDQPACFYLGQGYDLATKAVRPEDLVLYEARNLTTHGVIVGMTGSGKTGLSIALLEEAAIDGIPAVIIDPKGDLTNLLLRFPDLAPSDFARWLNPDEARLRNRSVDQYAEELSQRWKKGLEETGQGLHRIREVTHHTDFRVYTPGSEAGLPLSILGTFSAPKVRMAQEDLTQKIHATATALLGLSGISADPVQSREHVLITQLIHHAWTNGRDLDLATLIQEIQHPTLRTIGAYNLETFFPSRDRLKFASQLNNLLASPLFSTWTQGEPLDLEKLLIRGGRPQHLIFYLAHLDDNQRMFFTTLLLEEMLNWTRRQTGTTNLRALLYFDEVFGYLPPFPANPPSKQPLLTLLKQARAFGVGILLATQNPVDLDYKALSNAGTWFIGKLQTERDKARLLDGLESVAAEQGGMTERANLDRVIASLGNRLFLMHNIHQGQPRLFQTRWTLSYLRGPMSRDEIHRISSSQEGPDHDFVVVALKVCNHCGSEVPAGSGSRCPSCGKNPWEEHGRSREALLANPSPATRPNTARKREEQEVASPTQGPPLLPHEISQFYLPLVDGSGKPGWIIEYQAWLLGFAEITFIIDRRAGREHTIQRRLLTQAPSAGHPAEWEKALSILVEPADKPQKDARWAGIPDGIDTARKVKSQEKDFLEFLYRNLKLNLWKSPGMDLISNPDETREEFLIRCKDEAKKRAEAERNRERIKFEPRMDAVRKSSSRGKEDRLARLEGDLKARENAIDEKARRWGEEVVELQIKPRKVDIRVSHFGLAWAPFWRSP